jgi:3'(2'), 5'-bisphosphate nucleotidase
MTTKTIISIINTVSRAAQAVLEIYESGDFGIEVKADNSPLTLADQAANKVIIEALKEMEYPILSEEGSSIEYKDRKNWKKFWLVDPLDGTKEFIKKNGEFTINIAFVEDGRATVGFVYAPILKDFYLGINNMTALKFSLDAGEQIKELPSNAQIIKVQKPDREIMVVASRSHFNEETKTFIDQLKKEYSKVDFISKGSSLKLCLVAEGSANIYPRFGPTMEWDTAAAHAVVTAAGGQVLKPDGTELFYNKEDLLNPFFIVRGASHKF